jgi:hypothetical protein
MSLSSPRTHSCTHVLRFYFSSYFLSATPRWSFAAASASRRQPPPPPHTRKPVLLQHRCNLLKLTEQSNSIPSASTARTTAPVSSSSAAARSRRRPDTPPPLSPCQAHHQHHITPRKLSSHFPAALRHSDHRNTVAAPRSPTARPCSPSTLWQNQPELHRLKCADPFSKGIKCLIIIRLLLLLYVAKGSSSLNLHEKWTILNRISQPCKGKPNSHAWNIQ